MAYLVDRWEDSNRKGKGKRWQVKWRVGASERSESFELKRDAEAFRIEVERGRRFGNFPDPQRGRVSFGEFSEKWWAQVAPRVKPTTANGYESVLRTVILPRWADVPLIQIEFVDVGVWIADLIAKGLSPSRIRQAHQVLCRVMDLAVIDKRIQHHSLREVSLPRMPKRKRHPYLTHSELQRLAGECGEWYPLVMLLGYVGLRWGEAIALKPSDFDGNRVHVERSISQVNGHLIEQTPKDGEHREIPVPVIVMDALRPLLDGDQDELIFRSREGTPLRGQNFMGRFDHNKGRAVRGVFLPALERAGLKRMRIHDLRHTAASLAVSSGANVLAVARMLGHADPRETLRTYADLFDSDLEDVAIRLDEAARRARDESLPDGVVALR